MYTSIKQTELVTLRLQEREGTRVVKKCFIFDLTSVQVQHNSRTTAPSAQMAHTRHLH